MPFVASLLDAHLRDALQDFRLFAIDLFRLQCRSAYKSSSAAPCVKTGCECETLVSVYILFI